MPGASRPRPAGQGKASRAARARDTGEPTGTAQLRSDPSWRKQLLRRPGLRSAHPGRGLRNSRRPRRRRHRHTDPAHRVAAGPAARPTRGLPALAMGPPALRRLRRAATRSATQRDARVLRQ